LFGIAIVNDTPQVIIYKLENQIKQVKTEYRRRIWKY